MKKLIRHFKRWNHWRKRNVNSKFHQFMVLIGLHNSPTMMQVIPEEEWKEIAEKMNTGEGLIFKSEDLKKLINQEEAK